MAITSLSIPVPAGNGSGAPVEISAAGWTKNFCLSGPFQAVVNIEISNNGADWVSIATCDAPGDYSRSFAAALARATVSGYVTGAPVLAMGTEVNVTMTEAIAVPASGVGVPSDVSEHGRLKTFVYSGGSAGTFNVEVSQDGGVTFSQLLTFNGPAPAFQSTDAAMSRVRVRRTGAGAATVTLASVTDSSPTGAPVASFVFRPGAEPGGNVFTDWQTLMTAVEATEGMKIVLFDDTIVSPCVIPAGTYNMRNAVMTGLLYKPTFAEAEEGVVFLELHRFDSNLILTFTGSTPPMNDIANGDVVLLERGAELHTSGAGAFIDLDSIAPGGGAIFVLRDGSKWATGTAPILDMPAGVNAAIATLGAFSELQSDTCDGAVGSSVQIVVTANTPVGVSSMDQPGFAGSLSLVGNTSRFNFQNVLTSDGSAPVGHITRCDPTLGGFNVFLPPAFNSQGEIVIVKNITASANVITVVADGADMIDGAPTLPIAAAWGGIILFSDGVSTWLAG